VLRPDGTEADADEYGLLGARGPAITPGYWSESNITYHSKLAGYWLTGDVAFHDEDGNYYLVDRAADSIETGTGQAYSVLMEEVLLNEVSDIADCTVVAGRHGDRPVPVAVVKLHTGGRDVKSVLDEANDVLRRSGQPELAVLEFARDDDDIPVGVTGKVLKRQLRDKYRTLPASTDAGGRFFATTLN